MYHVFPKSKPKQRISNSISSRQFNLKNADFNLLNSLIFLFLKFHKFVQSEGCYWAYSSCFSALTAATSPGSCPQRFWLSLVPRKNHALLSTVLVFFSSPYWTEFSWERQVQQDSAFSFSWVEICLLSFNCWRERTCHDIVSIPTAKQIDPWQAWLRDYFGMLGILECYNLTVRFIGW